MPTESELRAALRSGDSGAPSMLDSDTIIRKARRRRTPKQVAVGSVTALAVAAIVIVGANSLPGLLEGGATSSGSLSDSSVAPESATGGRDASQSTGEVQTPLAPDALNRCDAPVVSLPPVTGPLILTVKFPEDVAADGGTVLGTATLTNSITERITATMSAAPFATVARDDITRWHSFAAAASTDRVIDLAPGESMTFGVRIDLVACSSADERDGTFGGALPALPPGSYQVSVLLELDGMDGGTPRLLQSSWIPLALR